jgi:hypothetical protein
MRGWPRALQEDRRDESVEDQASSLEWCLKGAQKVRIEFPGDAALSHCR